MKRNYRALAVTLIAGLVLGSSMVMNLYAQTDSTGTPIPNKAKGGGEKFLLAGEVFTMWTSNKVNGFPTTNSFGSDPLGLMLMPLVKLSDKLFLDVQVAVAANPGPGGGASASLNEAIIYYRLAPAAYIFAGNFQPRWGLYEGILDDFTNRYCSNPIGMGIGAATESGIGIQGGFQAGYSKFSYQVYAANGPQLIVDSSGATNGQLDYGNYTDNNTNKTIGGSLGYLPFSNSSLEIGVSGQYTPKTGAAYTAFENISSMSFAAHLNYYHVFSPIMLRLQGQYEYTKTDNFNLYTNSSDTALLFPKFDNVQSGWYAGLTLRLSGASSPFLSNLELGGRLSQLTLPAEALWGGKPMIQATICLT
ncbi:MAG TPA: hypothetical protein VNZ45_13005, partial [Bacteroidia bacterium]|nr:hypothetical protein [Bacteroidia bacterium]